MNITHNTTDYFIKQRSKDELVDILLSRGLNIKRNIAKPVLVEMVKKQRDELKEIHDALQKRDQNNQKELVAKEKNDPIITASLIDLRNRLNAERDKFVARIEDFQRRITEATHIISVCVEVKQQAANIFLASEKLQQVMPLATYIAGQLENRTLPIDEIMRQMLATHDRSLTACLEDGFKPRSTDAMGNIQIGAEFASNQYLVKLLRFCCGAMRKNLQEKDAKDCVHADEFFSG